MLGFGKRKERKEMKKEAKMQKRLNKMEEKEMKLLEKERKEIEPMLAKGMKKRFNKGEKIEGMVTAGDIQCYFIKTTEGRYFIGGINQKAAVDQAVLRSFNRFAAVGMTAKIQTTLNRNEILGITEDTLGTITLNTTVGDIVLFRASYFIKERLYEEIQNLL